MNEDEDERSESESSECLSVAKALEVYNGIIASLDAWVRYRSLNNAIEYLKEMECRDSKIFTLIVLLCSVMASKTVRLKQV